MVGRFGCPLERHAPRFRDHNRLPVQTPIASPQPPTASHKPRPPLPPSTFVLPPLVLVNNFDQTCNVTVEDVTTHRTENYSCGSGSVTAVSAGENDTLSMTTSFLGRGWELIFIETTNFNPKPVPLFVYTIHIITLVPNFIRV